MNGRRGHVVVWAVVALWAAAARGQDLGHRLGGTIGLDAARAPRPGVYLADRLVVYRSGQLNDREGEPLPLDVDSSVVGNALGVAAAFDAGPLVLSAAAAAPLVHVSLSVGQLRAGIDEFGLGDVFVRPLGVAWRGESADLVAGYALYLPTGRFEPGEGNTSSGHVTHQFSAGGTLWLAGRRLFVTALGSYDLNQKKRGIDITRGDLVNVQGGAGVSLRQVIELGMAGYALWQVEDDTGADVPPAIRGARDHAWGLGPEVAVLVPYARTRLHLRAVRDIVAEARPSGWVIVLGATVQAWSPDAPSNARRIAATSSFARALPRRDDGVRGPDQRACWVPHQQPWPACAALQTPPARPVEPSGTQQIMPLPQQ
jgi:hypothetical protein